MNSPQYVARLCWNSKGWKYPTGDVEKLEANSHQADEGFGYEEWVFDFARLVDGWRYGFVQGVNKSRRRLLREGEGLIDLRLFAIPVPGRKHWVARISKCHILDDAQIEVAHERSRERGYLSAMDMELKRLGVDKKQWPSQVPPDWMFNLRFRPEDVEMLNPPQGVPAGSELNRFDRYSLYRSSRKIAAEEGARVKWKRKGTNSPLSTKGRSVPSKEATAVDPVHAKMQNEIMALLQSRFGRPAVVAEEDFVDLKVRNGRREIWIEIKNGPSLQALREGMGQLLEYVYGRGGASSNVPELAIVGTTAPCKRTEAVLRKLKERHGLEIAYVPFHLGQKKFQLPL